MADEQLIIQPGIINQIYALPGEGSISIPLVPFIPQHFSSQELKAKFKKKNKVCIVGFADSRDQAPYNDDSYEIWGLNSLFENIPRWDLWFEIHDRKIFGIDTNKEVGYGLTRTGQPYFEALSELNCKGIPTPVMMVEQYPDVKSSVRYPIEDIILAFDPGKCRPELKTYKDIDYRCNWNGYFTNSVSYMLALAIDWGYEEISIYGVDMATIGGGEYAAQRPSCEFYVGVAVGKGIPVHIPHQADLLKTRFLYGFEDEKMDRFMAKISKLQKSMQERLNQATQNHDFAQKQIDQYIGALECSKEIIKIWG